MSKGVKIITGMKEEEVVLLKDVDVKFVSLVRHGANQSPFRVIKSDGGKDMPKVIQSIILPNGVTLSSLAEKDELAWLTEAKQTEVEKFDEYQKIVQIPEGDFVKGSLQLAKIHENGSFVIVGEIKDQGAMKAALTLGGTGKQLEIPVGPMNEPLAVREGPAFVLTFRDMFEKELSSFLDVVRGALSQSQSDAKKRKTSVMNALDSFRSFLAVGLDELSKSGGKGGKSKKEDVTEVNQVVERILAAINKEKQGGSDMLFANLEDFTAAVIKILDEREKNHAGDDKEKTASPGTFKMKNLGTGEEFEVPLEAKEPTKSNATGGAGGEKKTDPGTETVEKGEKDLVKKVEILSKRIEELEGQLSGEPSAARQDDALQADKDKPVKSPFDGMFTTGRAQGGMNRHM